jgi:O-antigen/teichoic acid export membrane protein
VRWTFWASLVMSAAMLVVGRPLLALFGPGFTEGFPILFVMVIGVLARASVGPAETLLTMAGQQTASAWVYGTTLVVALLLHSIFVPIYGVWGAAFAMAATLIFESVVLAGAVKRRLGLDVFVLAPSRRTVVRG